MTTRIVESTIMKRPTLIAALTAMTAVLTATGAVHAHEGHGLPGISHWHSTDIWGFMAVAALIAAAVWMKGRK